MRSQCAASSRRSSATRCDIRSTELGQTVAILRRVVARDVEEVVTNKDAREVDIGAKTSELRVHVVVVGVQSIELRVDVLRFSRQREHRHHDQEQETSKPDRRDRPGSEPHAHLHTLCHTQSFRSLTRDAGHTHPVKRGETTTKRSLNGTVGLPDKSAGRPRSTGWCRCGGKVVNCPTCTGTETNKASLRRPIRCRREWTRSQPSLLARFTRTVDQSVVVLANRGPYRQSRSGRGPFARGSGGLVTALEPLMQACNGVWVAHGTGSTERIVLDGRAGLNVPPAISRFRLRSVWLSTRRRTRLLLRVLQRRVVAAVPPDPREARVSLQRLPYVYAESMRDSSTPSATEADTDSPVVLVQDYHFALAPRMIRTQVPHAPSWPSGTFRFQAHASGRCVPGDGRCSRASLAVPLLDFKRCDDCLNFVHACEYCCDAHIAPGENAVVYEDVARWFAHIRCRSSGRADGHSSRLLSSSAARQSARDLGCRSILA